MYVYAYVYLENLGPEILVVVWKSEMFRRLKTKRLLPDKKKVFLVLCFVKFGGSVAQILH